MNRDTRFTTVEQIQRASAEAGGLFFTPETMRFFHSKVHPGVYDGRFFITSEQYDTDRPRRYHVRVILNDGSVRSAVEESFTFLSDAEDLASQHLVYPAVPCLNRCGRSTYRIHSPCEHCLTDERAGAPDVEGGW